LKSTRTVRNGCFIICGAFPGAVGLCVIVIWLYYSRSAPPLRSTQAIMLLKFSGIIIGSILLMFAGHKLRVQEHCGFLAGACCLMLYQVPVYYENGDLKIFEILGPGFWLMWCGLVMIVVGSICGIVRIRRRPLPGHCPACGYNLKGTLAAGRTECPECGAKIAVGTT